MLDAPKKLSTVRKEELILARWLVHIGDLPLDRIGRPHVTSYLQTILEDGRTRRTRNVHLSIFRNLLRFFSDKGLLVERSLPTAGVKLLRHRTPRRDFLTTEQVQKLIDQAKYAGSNGAMLADLLKLLAYSGAREMEALRLRWPDVDFDTRRLHIGRDGQTKNREPRTVDFSPDLAAHLRDMHTRKARILHGCFRRPNERIARSMSIGRIPTRSGISAGDSRAFLTFNFTICATTSRAGA